MRILILFFFLIGCAHSVDDYIQETKGGGTYVKRILNLGNLLTCKKVAYCKEYEDSEWEECKTQKQAEDAFKTHAEVLCVDIVRGDEFDLTLAEWEEKKHQFGEYRNEDIFALLDNARYVIENTELYDGRLPEMIEDFKEFHFKRDE